MTSRQAVNAAIRIIEQEKDFAFRTPAEREQLERIAHALRVMVVMHDKPVCDECCLDEDYVGCGFREDGSLES